MEPEPRASKRAFGRTWPLTHRVVPLNISNSQRDTVPVGHRGSRRGNNVDSVTVADRLLRDDDQECRSKDFSSVCELLVRVVEVEIIIIFEGENCWNFFATTRMHIKKKEEGNQWENISSLLFCFFIFYFYLIKKS